MPSVDHGRFQGGEIELRANDDDSFRFANNTLRNFFKSLNLKERTALLYCRDDTLETLQSLSNTRNDSVFTSNLQDIMRSIAVMKPVVKL